MMTSEDMTVARESINVAELVALVSGLRTLIDERDRRYMELLDAQKQAVFTALQSAERAVQKAESASEKRFDGVNEFRATLADQQRTFIPRAEVEMMFRALEAKALGNATLIEHINSERAGIRGGWGYAAGVAGLMLTLFSLFMVLWRFNVP